MRVMSTRKRKREREGRFSTAYSPGQHQLVSTDFLNTHTPKYSRSEKNKKNSRRQQWVVPAHLHVQTSVCRGRNVNHRREHQVFALSDSTRLEILVAARQQIYEYYISRNKKSNCICNKAARPCNGSLLGGEIRTKKSFLVAVRPSVRSTEERQNDGQRIM